MSRSINSPVTTKNTVKAYSSQSFNVPGNSFKFIAVTDSDDEFVFAGQIDNEIYVPKSGKPAILSKSAIEALDNGASMDDMKVLCSVTRLQVSRLVNEPFSVKFFIYTKNENTSNVKKLNKDILDMMFADFEVEKAETVKPEFSENGKKYLESENTLFTQEELIYKFFNRYILKAKVEEKVVVPVVGQVLGKSLKLVVQPVLTKQQKAALTRAANKLKAGK
jgi:hypothetical protein